MFELVMPKSAGFEDELVNISLERLIKPNGFTNDDLRVSSEVCRRDGYGKLYGHLPQFGTTYRGRSILPLAVISMDSEYGAQAYRSAGNAAFENIKNSIMSDGWNLNYLPVMVGYHPGKKEYFILEGRTRIDILKMLQVTGTLLVDVFELTDETANIKGFPMFANLMGTSAGKPTEADWETYLTTRFDEGFFKVDTSLNEVAARKKFINDLYQEVINLGGKITKAKVGKIAVPIMSGNSMFKPTIQFIRGHEEALQYVQKKLKIDLDGEYQYVCVNADEYGVIKQLVQRQRKNDDTRPIRVIVFSGQLNPMNPANDFQLANINVYPKMLRAIEDAVELWAPGAKIDNSQCEIYGTIPQCYALAKRFPMNKLIVYKDLTDADFTN